MHYGAAVVSLINDHLLRTTLLEHICACCCRASKIARDFASHGQIEPHDDHLRAVLPDQAEAPKSARK